MKRVELELISNRNPQIVEKDSGVQFMLDNRRLDDLLMLYKCFRREDTNLNVVIKYLCSYIELDYSIGERALIVHQERGSWPFIVLCLKCRRA